MERCCLRALFFYPASFRRFFFKVHHETASPAIHSFVLVCCFPKWPISFSACFLCEWVHPFVHQLTSLRSIDHFTHHAWSMKYPNLGIFAKHLRDSSQRSEIPGYLFAFHQHAWHTREPRCLCRVPNQNGPRGTERTAEMSLSEEHLGRTLC